MKFWDQCNATFFAALNVDFTLTVGRYGFKFSPGRCLWLLRAAFAAAKCAKLGFMSRLLRIAQLIATLLGCAALLALSAHGLGNALRNVGDMSTFAEVAMTVLQLLYSALGPAVVVVRLARHRWLLLAWRAWAASLVAAVALIPWAWIEPSALQTLGFAAAGSGCAALISVLVLLGTGRLWWRVW